MSEWVFQPHDVKDFEALQMAMVDAGIAAEGLTLNGKITVITDATEAATLAAVEAAADGGLLANKSAMIKLVGAKSLDLVSEGVETWDAGKYANLSRDDAVNRWTAYEFYSDNVGELSAATPYIIYTIEGGIVSTTTLSDVEGLAKDSKHRLDYIYTTLSNSDSSKSELILRANIDAAANQAALDAIEDTRE